MANVNIRDKDVKSFHRWLQVGWFDTEIISYLRNDFETLFLHSEHTEMVKRMLEFADKGYIKVTKEKTTQDYTGYNKVILKHYFEITSPMMDLLRFKVLL